MLASYTPFYSSNRMKMYKKIVRGEVKFPSHMSAGAKQIIGLLLAHKPTKRLGIINGGAARIKEHEWFKGFDWRKLLDMKHNGPILPAIKNDHDCSNFDDMG